MRRGGNVESTKPRETILVKEETKSIMSGPRGDEDEEHCSPPSCQSDS